jgi:hypothetical protein
MQSFRATRVFLAQALDQLWVVLKDPDDIGRDIAIRKSDDL